jgi:hypothetical protein
MAKTFLLAKSFYRYHALILRDHGMSRNLAGWIPAGVFISAVGRVSRRHQPTAADVTIPKRATEPGMWNRTR